MNKPIRCLRWTHNGPAHQTGAATLMVSAVLLLLLTIMSFTAARVGMQQQRLAGTDVRNREVREAAEAGLETALAWLRENKCNGGACNPGACTEAPCFTNPASITMDSGYTYDLAVTFASRPGRYLLVRSTAVTQEDNTIRGAVEHLIRQTDYLTINGHKAPPIVVDGCMTSPGGSPNIYPRPGGTAALSLATDTPGDGSSGSCLELDGTGHVFKIEVQTCKDGPDRVTCGLGGHGFDVPNPGNYLAGDAMAIAEPKAWNYIFDIPYSEAKALAAAAGQVYASDTAVPNGPPGDVPFIHYTADTPFSGNNPKIYGSPDKPVVLIMSGSSCPKFNGGVTIYGFLYYEAPAGGCNGWGGADIIGSVVFEDDVTDLNANTNFYDLLNLKGSETGDPILLDDVAKVLGSWRDW